MGSVNRVFAMGNLTKDPEMKPLATGTLVADLRLAISESYTNQKGEKVESVCYVDVVVWGRQAEVCKQYLHKGSPVFVEGRLQLDTWEKNGQKRSLLKIRADHVQFVGGPGGEGRGGKDADESAPFAATGASGRHRVEEIPAGIDEENDVTPF